MKPWAAQLRGVAGIIRRGGIVAYPTESCYGLGCDPRNPKALVRLLRLKGRPWHKGLILIAAEIWQLEPFHAALTPSMQEKMQSHWPGPVTLVFPAQKSVLPWLRGRRRSIALRQTAHAPAKDLCLAFGGALVSTSANPAGMRPARSPADLRRYFGAQVDAILVGPLGKDKKPSRIIDTASGRVLRG